MADASPPGSPMKPSIEQAMKYVSFRKRGSFP
jgi:hypothetical protein